MHKLAYPSSWRLASHDFDELSGLSVEYLYRGPLVGDTWRGKDLIVIPRSAKPDKTFFAIGAAGRIVRI